MMPFKQIMVIDFETAWDKKTYTLSNMTTEEYIRSPKFKAWGAAYYYIDSPDKPVWVSGKDLPAFFGGVDWDTTAVLAHNAQFDVRALCEAGIYDWEEPTTPEFWERIVDTQHLAHLACSTDAMSLDSLTRKYLGASR